MNNKRKTHKLERISEDKRIYLISGRQKKNLKPHGKKVHQNPRYSTGITFQWWHLLPGAYYIYEYSKPKKGYSIHRVLIREINEQLIEEHRQIESIPQWLKSFIQTLPEYEEKDVKKYNIFQTRR